MDVRDFSGSPVLTTLTTLLTTAGDAVSIPDLGTKTLHASQGSQKNKNKNKKTLIVDVSHLAQCAA